ncbi:hypothetical protein D3C86_1478450 [compost metagenome]
MKESLRTIGFVVSSSPISSGAPVMTLNTPGGIPARSARSASANAEYGVLLAGRTTIVHPAARAAPAFRVMMVLGKFHGVMAAHTPTGCFITIARRSAAGAGMVSPYGRRASSANHSMKAAPLTTSERASARGLPCSAVIN